MTAPALALKPKRGTRPNQAWSRTSCRRIGEFLRVPLVAIVVLGAVCFVHVVFAADDVRGDDARYAAVLAVDIDGAGIPTLTWEAGMYFDFDGDGRAESSGWVAPRLTLLVLDRDGNGLIETGAELFGNFTPLNTRGRAPNGFAALAALDFDRGEASTRGRQ